MAEQKLPVKIVGPFAHFYPQSIIEIPDDFWDEFKKKAYPRWSVRPENAHDLNHYELLVVTGIGSYSDYIYDYTLVEKEYMLIEFFFGKDKTDAIWRFLINNNPNYVLEFKEGSYFPALQYGNVRIRLEPGDRLRIKLDTTLPIGGGLHLGGYKWMEV